MANTEWKIATNARFNMRNDLHRVIYRLLVFKKYQLPIVYEFHTGQVYPHSKSLLLMIPGVARHIEVTQDLEVRIQYTAANTQHLHIIIVKPGSALEDEVLFELATFLNKEIYREAKSRLNAQWEQAVNRELTEIYRKLLP